MRNVNWTMRMTAAFSGLNRRERIGDGEWADEENLTTEQYPVAMTRDRRVKWDYFGTETPGGDPEREPFLTPAWCDATVVDKTLYIAGYANSVDKIPDSDERSRYTTYGIPYRIVGFGGGVFTIDGTYINFDGDVDFARWKADERHDRPTNLVMGRYELTDLDGTSPTYYWDAEDPPVEGDVRYDAWNGTLERYSSVDNTWVPIPTCRTRFIFGKGEVEGLHEGDGIHIKESGTGLSIEGDFLIAKAYSDNTNDYIIVEGLVRPQEFDTDHGFAIERRYPVFDYICSFRNRIWGCRYGYNDKGAFVNEIYASALGKPLVYFNYGLGVADEAWMASVGHGGPWTGIAAVEDEVYFFKEDRIYVVSGTDPSNLGYKEIEAPGVAPTQSRSLIAKDGAIYYVAKRGVYKVSAYGYSVCISEKLRFPIESQAIGVADGDKLRWITLDAVYVYDIGLNAWMVESPISPDGGFAALEFSGFPVVLVAEQDEDNLRNTYLSAYTFGEKKGEMPAISSEWFWESTTEAPAEWHAETGIRGLDDPEQKRLREIRIRLKADEGTLLRISIQLDEDGQWEEILNERRRISGTFEVRHAPQRRCDVYRLKFEGTGSCVIYSVTEDTEYGGD